MELQVITTFVEPVIVDDRITGKSGVTKPLGSIFAGTATLAYWELRNSNWISPNCVEVRPALLVPKRKEATPGVKLTIESGILLQSSRWLSAKARALAPGPKSMVWTRLLYGPVKRS